MEKRSQQVMVRFECVTHETEAEFDNKALLAQFEEAHFVALHPPHEKS